MMTTQQVWQQLQKFGVQGWVEEGRLVVVGGDLTGANLSGWNLAGAQLTGLPLREGVLEGTDLSDANLEGSDLRGANLRAANLARVNLRNADLRGADLRHANLTGAKLKGARLAEARLAGACLARTDLRGHDLRGFDLAGTDLRHACLQGLSLRGANLRQADLSAADLRQAELVGLDLQGVRFCQADLSAADLTAADLRQADLTFVVGLGAVLVNAKLDGARLSFATLNEARLDAAAHDVASSQGASLENVILVPEKDGSPEAAGEVGAAERWWLELRAVRGEYEALKARSIPAQPRWRRRNFTVVQDRALMLWPSDVNAAVGSLVEQVLADCGLRPERLAGLFEERPVMEDAWERLCTARLLLVDVTGRSPAAFYYLGLAHALGRPTLLLAPREDDLPLDFRGDRYVLYPPSPEDPDAWVQTLRTVVEAMLQESSLG